MRTGRYPDMACRSVRSGSPSGAPSPPMVARNAGAALGGAGEPPRGGAPVVGEVPAGPAGEARKVFHADRTIPRHGLPQRAQRIAVRRAVAADGRPDELRRVAPQERIARD